MEYFSNNGGGGDIKFNNSGLLPTYGCEISNYSDVMMLDVNIAIPAVLRQALHNDKVNPNSFQFGPVIASRALPIHINKIDGARATFTFYAMNMTESIAEIAYPDSAMVTPDGEAAVTIPIKHPKNNTGPGPGMTMLPASLYQK